MQLLMMNFYTRLDAHMKSLTPKLDFKELHYLSRIATAQFHYWKKWDLTNPDNPGRVPTDAELEKLAAVPQLGLTLAELRAWRLLDTHGAQEIIKAFDLRFPPGTEEGKEAREMLDRMQAG